MTKDTVITFEMSLQDAQVVLNALRELPHRIVADLIQDLYRQASEQTAAQTPEAPEPPIMEADAG